MENDPKIDGAALLNAEEVIAALGGIRPAAAKLNVPVTTVQGWKNRGRIPANRQAEIEAALANLSVDLSAVLASPARTDDSSNDAPPPKEVREGVAESVNQGDETPERAGAEVEEGAPAVSASAPSEPVSTASGRGLALGAITLSICAIAGVGLLVFRPELLPQSASPSTIDTAALTERLRGEFGNKIAETAQRFTAISKENSKIAEQIRALEGELTTLAEKIEGLGGIRPEGASEAFGLLRKEVLTLREDFAGISGKFDATIAREIESARGETNDVRQTLQRLAAKVGDIEGNQEAFRAQAASVRGKEQADSTGRSALLLSVGQLETSLRYGLNLENALARVRHLADGQPEILKLLNELGAESLKNSITDYTLSEGFEGIRAKLAAGRPPPEGWSTAQGAWARVKSVIGLRKLGKDSQSPVTQTERALVQRDFDSVLVATEGFQDQKVETWRNQVIRRLKFEDVLQRINERLMANSGEQISRNETSPDTRSKK